MLRNTLKTTIFLAALGGLMVAVGSFFGRGGAVIGLVLGLVTVGAAYWGSDKLAIRAARAEPADPARYPQYHQIVAELSQRAGIPMPRLYVSPEQQPNAFATGRNPKHAAVAVTQGLLAVCSPEEVRAVLAHELAHVKNRDILIGSVAAAVATGISFIANMAMWGAMFGGGRDDDEGGNPIALLATAMLAPLAAGMLQMAISRSREFEADRTGAELIGTGAPLASALRRLDAYAARVPMDVQPSQASHFIVNPLTGRQVSFANLFRTHPTTEERVQRLLGHASPRIPA
jgi:heat shock protein HtpX